VTTSLISRIGAAWRIPVDNLSAYDHAFAEELALFHLVVSRPFSGDCIPAFRQKLLTGQFPFPLQESNE